MLGKGGLATAVAAKDSHKAALLHLQIQIFKDLDPRRVIDPRIGIRQMVNRNDILHSLTS